MEMDMLDPVERKRRGYSKSPFYQYIIDHAEALRLVFFASAGSYLDHYEEMCIRDRYCATLQLGATTPSFDSEHEIDATYPYEHITEEMVRSALHQFTGEIDQRPPTFSAVKVGGIRAYDLARQGQEVELAHKRITIHELELLSFTPPTLQLRIVCSRGTYIRSLARDLGTALDSGAYLTQLVRTRSGEVSQADCFSPVSYTHLDVYKRQPQAHLHTSCYGTLQSIYLDEPPSFVCTGLPRSSDLRRGPTRRYRIG